MVTWLNTLSKLLIVWRRNEATRKVFALTADELVVDSRDNCTAVQINYSFQRLWTIPVRIEDALRSPVLLENSLCEQRPINLVSLLIPAFSAARRWNRTIVTAWPVSSWPSSITNASRLGSSWLLVSRRRKCSSSSSKSLKVSSGFFFSISCWTWLSLMVDVSWQLRTWVPCVPAGKMWRLARHVLACAILTRWSSSIKRKAPPWTWSESRKGILKSFGNVTCWHSETCRAFLYEQENCAPFHHQSRLGLSEHGSRRFGWSIQRHLPQGFRLACIPSRNRGAARYIISQPQFSLAGKSVKHACDVLPFQAVSTSRVSCFTGHLELARRWWRVKSAKCLTPASPK